MLQRRKNPTQSRSGLRSIVLSSYLWILSSGFFLPVTHNFLAAGFLSPHLSLMQLTGECSLEQILPSATAFLRLVGFHHILPPDERVREPPVYLARSISPTAQADPVSSHREYLPARKQTFDLSPCVSVTAPVS